jgi:hypothetical protein
MNFKVITIASIGILWLHENAGAQLGNLIKKVKENITKDKTIPVKTIPVKTIPDIKTSTETSAKADVQNPLAKETEWQFASNEGYSESGARYSYEQVVRNEKKLNTYTNIRKVGEPGCLHFAKDYPELKNITAPENKNISIIFHPNLLREGPGFLLRSLIRAKAIFMLVCR